MEILLAPLRFDVICLHKRMPHMRIRYRIQATIDGYLSFYTTGDYFQFLLRTNLSRLGKYIHTYVCMTIK